MLTTSFIPGLMAFACSRTYKFDPDHPAYYIDGAYSAPVPCPGGGSTCIKVSAKPYGCWPSCKNGVQSFFFLPQIYPGIRKDGNLNPILPGTLTRADYETDKLAFNYTRLLAEKEAMYEAGRLDAAYYVSTL
jgi:hypothetical protein